MAISPSVWASWASAVDDLPLELGRLCALGPKGELPVPADDEHGEDGDDQDPMGAAHGVAPPWGEVVAADVSPGVAVGVAVGVGVGAVPPVGARSLRHRLGGGLEEHDGLEVGALAGTARLAVAALGLGAASRRSDLDLLLGRLAERHARHALHVVQARQQTGDLGLSGRAARERDGGRVDRAAQLARRAACAAGAGGDVAGQRLERDVGRDGA